MTDKERDELLLEIRGGLNTLGEMQNAQSDRLERIERNHGARLERIERKVDQVDNRVSDMRQDLEAHGMLPSSAEDEPPDEPPAEHAG